LKYQHIGRKLQNLLQKIHDFAQKCVKYRDSKFNQALVQIEQNFLNIQENGTATWEQSRKTTKQAVRIILYHTDFYFLIGGMALLVFATRSFTEPGVDYGPWRPIVISLAALLAGIIPLLMVIVLYPLHILKNVSTWILVVLNVVFSSYIFARVEPIIPSYFYTEGILGYQDLIYGILVFYAIALGYLQLRLHKFYCYNHYRKTHALEGFSTILPADIRGNILALSAQDHYVNIITENGEHLNRMTMKEAVSMLPENTGIQVHRSHWVSNNAMMALSKNSDRYFLKLRNGQQVPVSKAKVEDVNLILDQR